MPTLLARVAAVAFGAAVFVLGAEMGARVAFRHVLQYDVEMWRYAKLLKVSGRTPGLRFEHRPNTVARLMGVEVRTNADGMRDEEYAREIGPTTLRIAVLGDSITLGWGVRQEDAYPEVLEKLLKPRFPENRVEVLNFGVGNYNTADEYEMLRRKALAYDPDVILVGVYLNDAEQSSLEKPPLLLERSMFAVWIWGRVDALLRQSGVREGYEEYFRNLYRAGQAGRVRMEAALGGILTVGRETGTKVVVAMLPDLHRLTPYPFLDIHSMFLGLVEGAGGVFVDLLPALPRGAAEGFWVSADDPHPNASAHELYAQALAEALPWEVLLRARRDKK